MYVWRRNYKQKAAIREALVATFLNVDFA